VIDEAKNAADGACRLAPGENGRQIRRVVSKRKPKSSSPGTHHTDPSINDSESSAMSSAISHDFLHFSVRAREAAAFQC
jgi:hypothetical protein